MHKKFAKDGLVVVTVSLDELTEGDAKETKDRVLDFLKKKEASFTNLLLDEDAKLWQSKLRFIAPPCYYVFSRQGKWTQFSSDVGEIDHAAIDHLVEELLKEK